MNEQNPNGPTPSPENPQTMQAPAIQPPNNQPKLTQASDDLSNKVWLLSVSLGVVALLLVGNLVYLGVRGGDEEIEATSTAASNGETNIEENETTNPESPSKTPGDSAEDVTGCEISGDQLTISLTNSSEDTVEYFLTVSLLDENGNEVDTTTSIFSFVTGGEEVRQTEKTYGQPSPSCEVTEVRRSESRLSDNPIDDAACDIEVIGDDTKVSANITNTLPETAGAIIEVAIRKDGVRVDQVAIGKERLTASEQLIVDKTIKGLSGSGITCEVVDSLLEERADEKKPGSEDITTCAIAPDQDSVIFEFTNSTQLTISYSVDYILRDDAGERLKEESFGFNYVPPGDQVKFADTVFDDISTATVCEIIKSNPIEVSTEDIGTPEIATCKFVGEKIEFELTNGLNESSDFFLAAAIYNGTTRVETATRSVQNVDPGETAKIDTFFNKSSNPDPSCKMIQAKPS